VCQYVPYDPKRVFRIYKMAVVLVSAVLVLLGSSLFAHGSSKKISACVSIPPLKYMLNKIGGEHVQVSVMVSPGANPATYEPDPRQMAALSETRLYFAIGVPFEKSWLPRFSKVNKNMRIVRLDREVSKRVLATEYEDIEQSNEVESGGNKDPHVWLSPALMRIMSGKAMRVFASVDPDNASRYRYNYLQFAREINQTDEQILELFSRGDTNRDKFMTLHPAWGYLARDYGLKQIPIELEGKTPGPKEMSKLIHLGEKLDIDTVFVQPQFSRKKAKTIADQIGARVVGLDPLSADWSDNLLEMAKKIHAGLRE